VVDRATEVPAACQAVEYQHGCTSHNNGELCAIPDDAFSSRFLILCLNRRLMSLNISLNFRLIKDAD
jgi:hypothetical protein